MKKLKHRSRPNQKKQREKSTQRVTSANRDQKWGDTRNRVNALHSASMSLALASVVMGAASIRDWAR
ncbi:hypothetical protein [Pararhizobium qamdonense]|uniref:hypothetical protein n=1 Tax=Pararhizobium qamdonense TaxID=3031126 RepID=UPI0023E2E27A|nr:hypothetical protein [Pararhizobium qamdonense]